MKYLQTITINGFLMTVGLFLGALLGPHLFPVRAVHADQGIPDVIRAHRFEVVSDAGKVGVDLYYTKQAPFHMELSPGKEVEVSRTGGKVDVFNEHGDISAAIAGFDGGICSNTVTSETLDVMPTDTSKKPAAWMHFIATGDACSMSVFGSKSSMTFFDDSYEPRLDIGFNSTVKKANPEETTTYSLSTIAGFKKDGTLAWIEKE